MRSILQKLLYLIQPEKRKYFAALIFFILIGAGADTLGIGLLLPFVSVISDPGNLQQYPLLIHLYTLLNVQSHQEFVIWLVALLVLVFVLKNGYLLFLAYIQNRVIASNQIALAHQLFDKYMHRPYTYYLQKNSAEMVTNLTFRLQQLGATHMLGTLYAVSDLITMFCIAVLLLVVDPLSFGIAMGTIGVAAAIFYHTVRKRLKHWGEQRKIFEESHVQSAYQGLGGIKEIRVLGREAYFVDHFMERCRGFVNADYPIRVLNMVPRLYNEVTIIFVTALIIIILILQERTIVSALPSLALFAGAAYRLAPSINRISGFVVNFLGNLPALDALYHELVALENEPVSTAGNGFDIRQNAQNNRRDYIALKHISYQYPHTDTQVLRNISMRIAKNQAIGLVGASGSGKTTLIDIILGLLTPTSGEVRVCGTNIHEHRADWRHMVGYIPQHIYLSDDTIRSNVAFGIRAADMEESRIWWALQVAQLQEFIQSLPQGLDTVVGERGVRLSGGQRQRIGIARALYHDPDVLIMDEATAALDNKTEQAFVESIGNLRTQKTLIIIAHRLDTVRQCDQLYVMHNGEIVDVGTYDELLVSSAEFKAIAKVS
jgi:ATP-binding cassette subfamily C protein